MKRVAIQIEEPAGVERKAWPVTQGIPFPDGELRHGQAVRVVSKEGDPLPTQYTTLTTWAADRKYVKWLLVDFQVDLSSRQNQGFFLEYGEDVEPLLPEMPVQMEVLDNGCTQIDTGSMQVELYWQEHFEQHERDGRLLAGIRINGREVLGRSGITLYMKDHAGREYTSQNSPAPMGCVEYVGPMHTSLRFEGWHGDSEGIRFCPYILRMHFYAGRPDIYFEHTFLFDQDPSRVELSGIGVRFSLADNFAQTKIVGSQSEPRSTDAAKKLSLLQRDDENYTISADGAEIDSGIRSEGWIHLAGDAGSITLALHEPWREHPKGLSVMLNEIDVQIYPADSHDTLKFHTPFNKTALQFNNTRDEAEFKRVVESDPTAPLNLKSLNVRTPEELAWVEAMLARYAPDRVASYNDTGTCNGFGTAKTTGFTLRFSSSSSCGEEAKKFAAAVQKSVIAPPSANYICGTRAARYIAPLMRDDADPIDPNILCNMFDRIVEEPRQKLRNYGMMDFGDLICSHAPTPSLIWLLYKDQPDIMERFKRCSKAYNNEANDQLHALWCLYLASGKREHFDAALAYGAHMADVDVIHLDGLDGKKKGLMHYHNCHHYTGGASPSHTCLAGLMLQYYLTGNRRIFDVCREVADWILSNREPCGIYRNRNWKLIRETTTPIANLLEFYQATWNKPYGDMARRTLKWLLLAMEEPGSFHISMYSAGEDGAEVEVEGPSGWLRQAGGMTPQMFYDAAKLFGEEDSIFREGMLTMVNRYVNGPGEAIWTAFEVGPEKVKRPDPGMNASMIAFAYELTGNPLYAIYARYYLREFFTKEFEVLRDPQKPGPGFFTSIQWFSQVPSLLCAVREAESKIGRDELSRTEMQWVDDITKTYGKINSDIRQRSKMDRINLGRIEGFCS